MKDQIKAEIDGWLDQYVGNHGAFGQVVAAYLKPLVDTLVDKIAAKVEAAIKA